VEKNDINNNDNNNIIILLLLQPTFGQIYHHCLYSIQKSSPKIMPPASKIIRMGTADPRMSSIVIHSGIVYLQGLTDTSSSDITGQTQNVLKRIDELLNQAGTSKSNLLTANIWVKDIGNDFQAMNEVWNAWLDPENKPVRATVEANMAAPEILVEIQVTAAVEEVK
jgi:enamine deaminase RidA (YjgF/YER057c/UK114 family)